MFEFITMWTYTAYRVIYGLESGKTGSARCSPCSSASLAFRDISSVQSLQTILLSESHAMPLGTLHGILGLGNEDGSVSPAFGVAPGATIPLPGLVEPGWLFPGFGSRLSFRSWSLRLEPGILMFLRFGYRPRFR